MFNILSAVPASSATMSDEAAMIFVIVLYIAIFGFIFGFMFLFWIFKAISVFKMSKKLNLNLPWIGFVPYALPFAYGRIAEMYNKNHFKKPIKFSILLLILQFVPGIAITAFYIVFIGVGVIAALLNSEVILIIAFLICYFVMFFILMASSFVVNLFNYLACWNVFAIFGGEKNILYFIMSLTLGIEPFLLFALRNKEPQNLREEFIPQTVEIPETVEVAEEN